MARLALGTAGVLMVFASAPMDSTFMEKAPRAPDTRNGQVVPLNIPGAEVFISRSDDRKLTAYQDGARGLACQEYLLLTGGRRLKEQPL